MCQLSKGESWELWCAAARSSASTRRSATCRAGTCSSRTAGSAPSPSGSTRRARTCSTRPACWCCPVLSTPTGTPGRRCSAGSPPTGRSPGTARRCTACCGRSTGPRTCSSARCSAGFEALHSGVTTVLDWCHCTDTPAHGDAALDALRQAPGRSVFCYGAGIATDGPVAAELARMRDRCPDDDGLVTMASKPARPAADHHRDHGRRRRRGPRPRAAGQRPRARPRRGDDGPCGRSRRWGSTGCSTTGRRSCTATAWTTTSWRCWPTRAPRCRSAPTSS